METMIKHALRDPVCGMVVGDPGLSAVHQGTQFYFCSEFCRRSFMEDPDRYVAAAFGQAKTDVGRRIAYFSMEVAMDSPMPTYSGGLGVLAGDTLKSAADLKIPMVGVSLLPANGNFDQSLDKWGNQRESPVAWDPSSFARKVNATVDVTIEGRPVRVGAWQYDIAGVTGYTVPLLLLDARVEGNAMGDRELTAWLYGGDERYRLAQEVILGIGGVRMLRALGYNQLERYHMNEGHASLLVLELLRERENSDTPRWDFNGVRAQCLFTTHTPVPVGHDQFAYDLVSRVLGKAVPDDVLRMLGGTQRLNMTYLGINLSSHVNGVAKKHGEVSEAMFPGYGIGSVTNGVHSRTWTSDSFKALFDRHVPGWANDPASLRHAVSIPRDEVWKAHEAAKAKMIEEVNRQTKLEFRTDVLTIGFARRATQYKRASLIFSDLQRLKELAASVGPMQMVFAGKAHPMDYDGKGLIRQVFEAARQLQGNVKVVYLPNYDLELGKLLTAGSDLWLNTPQRPMEASGTSGMKAAHNGVPSLSVLDGWWIEGHIEGVTGWSIGRASDAPSSADENAQDAADLYDKLRTVILPTFYRDRDRWTDIMRQTIAFNASFFNTHRMVQQYAASAYM
jgi:glycogen phosphorylase